MGYTVDYFIDYHAPSDGCKPSIKHWNEHDRAFWAFYDLVNFVVQKLIHCLTGNFPISMGHSGFF